jgi:hypothetical protein
VSLLVYDVVAFAVAYALAAEVIRSLASVDPSALNSVASLVEPFLPVLALGVVLVAGVMFELTTTARFATSDAINWLPVRPEEYVLASSLAIAYSYSLAVALLAGVGLAVAISTSTVPVYLLAAGISVVSLLEGGFLIEMLRSATQRASAWLGGRAGRLTVVFRAAIILLVLLLFQVVFNPVILEELLRSIGSISVLTTFVPLLWGPRAVYAGLDGAALLTVLFTSGQLAVVAGLGWVAATLRQRYWSPAPTEIRVEGQGFGSPHRMLRALGFSNVESSLISKDLRGLTRRREVLPILMTPIVLGIVGLLGVTGASSGQPFSTVIWGGWVAGFFALILALTSVGQERRSIQNLYSLPVPSGAVFRAKAGTVLLVTLTFAVGWSLVTTLWFRYDGFVLLGIAGASAIAVVEGTFIGLAFAARYSDFQERPRPQFLRPAAMLSASMTGMLLIFASILPIAFALGGLPVAGGAVAWAVSAAAAAALVIGGAYAFASAGFTSLLREMPF